MIVYAVRNKETGEYLGRRHRSYRRWTDKIEYAATWATKNHPQTAIRRMYRPDANKCEIIEVTLEVKAEKIVH